MPVPTGEMKGNIREMSIRASRRKRKMFLFLVLISPQCILAFSCAYVCTYLTSVNQAYPHAGRNQSGGTDEIMNNFQAKSTHGSLGVLLG